MTRTKRIVAAAFPWIIFVHVVLFLVFWLTNSLFYSEVNDYLTNLLGTRYDFISICLLLAGVVGVWTIIRWAAERWHFRHPLQGVTPWLYGIVGLIFLVFFYGSFWYLFRQSPIQVARIGQMILYFRIVLDPILLVAVTALATLWVVRRLPAHKPAGATSYFSVAAPAAGICALVWALLLLYPPDSVYQGALPAKPKVIAHRGASMLAPENTLIAMERAAELGVYGLETDLSLSRDEVPFLMHDTTLKRTTDVAEVFPGRENDKAEEFSLADIKQLNAGKWFIKTDPYHTIASGIVTVAHMEQYKKQQIPTLAEMLQIVREHKLIFRFDLKDLTTPLPSGSTFFGVVFRQIHAAGIDSQVSFLVNDKDLQVLRAEAPAMRPTYGGNYEKPEDAAVLKAQGYVIVNIGYGLSKDWIKKYQAAGLWVDLFTVDEPWQYSRLWLIGADSVTSSNAHTLLAMDQPMLSLPYSTYVVIWGTIGLVCLGIVFGLPLYVTRA